MAIVDSFALNSKRWLVLDNNAMIFSQGFGHGDVAIVKKFRACTRVSGPQAAFPLKCPQLFIPIRTCKAMQFCETTAEWLGVGNSHAGIR